MRYLLPLFWFIGFAKAGCIPLPMTFFAEYSQLISLTWGMYLGGLLLLITVGIGAFHWQKRQKSMTLEADKRNLIEQMREEKLQVQLAQQQAEWQGRIDEHRNLATDLHDNLSGVLFGLNLKLERIVRQRTIAHHDLTDVRSSLTDAQNKVRLVANSLMSDELQQRGGLHPALHQFIADVNEYGSTQFGLYVAPQAAQLIMPVQVGLYYIAFELVNNMLRHAQARQATLHIRFTNPSTVTLTVRDDGVGLSVEQLTDHRNFVTIRRRIDQLSGTLLVTNLPDGGLRTEVTLPVSESPDK
ncbi:sensor histidine kinase [Spirosoma montaniterrae]|uniref:sensor histidine kinase n=1 Tax=Spirosoma montaniterrae TaxID=1178516 RepID=UPI0012F9ECEF|nr:ATP-binding protein [Spirosoma montaniterrae]